MQYSPQFIQVKTYVHHMIEESKRSREVWGKLDATLDRLNDTLLIQGGEIKALKDDVEEIKEAVVK